MAVSRQRGEPLVLNRAADRAVIEALPSIVRKAWPDPQNFIQTEY